MRTEFTNKNSSEELFKQAMERHVYTAERNITRVRSAIIFFNLIIYYLFLDKSFSIPILANVISIIACAYTLYVEIQKPFKKYAIFVASYFTAISDCVLITLWLIATGSYHSPYFLLWYISLFAVAFRFSVLTTIISSLLYCTSYLLLIYIFDYRSFVQFFPEISIRLGYILFSGILGTLITYEHSTQTHQKIVLEKLSQEAREGNEKLIYQTTLYENMLQAQSELGEGVAIVRDRKMIYVNDAFCTIFGSDREEFLNNESNFHLVTSEERSMVRHKDADPDEEKSFDGYIETIISTKNGEKKFIGYSSKVFEMNEEKNLFFVIRDITEQKSRDTQLKKKTRDLVSQNEELEQFVYIASHDLQEPLRMITSFLSQLENKYKGALDEKAQQYINFATSGAERMRRIILDLLDYSRLGRKEYNFEKINLNILLQEVLQIYGNRIAENNVEIIYDKLPEVYGGKTLLNEVFQNLIGNAIKYKKEDIRCRIEIKSTETPSHWQFSIADNGIGIEKMFFDKIFVIFQRLHNKNEYSGTGIGLAICKKIVENHKGKIWVESTEGKGSTFYFTIIK